MTEMSTNFLLIHSPLVGPLSWMSVAEELAHQGHTTNIPNLSLALEAGPSFWRAFARQARKAVRREHLDQPVLLVGHSAAGSFLPVIGEALSQKVSGYIFVDARLPKNGKSLFDADHPAAADRQKAMAKDGWLPPWNEWLGEEAMRTVIPDDMLRQRFQTELHPIPLALFEEPIPVFASWPDAPCGYIRFSEFYKPQAQEARDSDWPTIDLEGGHLHTLVAPSVVAETILALAKHMGVDTVSSINAQEPGDRHTGV